MTLQLRPGKLYYRRDGKISDPVFYDPDPDDVYKFICGNYFLTPDGRVFPGADCKNDLISEVEDKDMDMQEGGPEELHSKSQLEYASGMRRDNPAGKIDYTLLPRFMFDRVARVMQSGIDKGYGRDSWQKACTPEELEHFKKSAWRHFLAWMDGDESEDHYGSLIFNANGAELLKSKLRASKS